MIDIEITVKNPAAHQHSRVNESKVAAVIRATVREAVELEFLDDVFTLEDDGIRVRTGFAQPDPRIGIWIHALQIDAFTLQFRGKPWVITEDDMNVSRVGARAIAKLHHGSVRIVRVEADPDLGACRAYGWRQDR